MTGFVVARWRGGGRSRRSGGTKLIYMLMQSALRCNVHIVSDTCSGTRRVRLAEQERVKEAGRQAGRERESAPSNKPTNSVLNEQLD